MPSSSSARRSAAATAILFVGTKKQAQESIAAEAERSGQHYVNNRWLGGMLTNFTTIKRRIQRLEALEARREAGEFERLTKKEASKLSEEIEKLNHALGGIRRMRRLPGALFIVDPHRESIAVAEARRLEIPIVAMTDTNCDPDLIDWVIPANDDAIRSVRLICEKVADAVLEANQERQARLDEEFEQAEALPPVDEAALAEDTDYTAALASRRGARVRAGAGRGRGGGAPGACPPRRRGRRRRERTRDRRCQLAAAIGTQEDQEGMTQTTMIKPEDVKQLRDQTGAGIMDCKRALEESEGDVDKAVAWLRAKGLSTAAKKAGREAREGVVTSYIHHGGRLGVLLELNCETDFVARTDDFQQLARELAMQVAGLGPLFVSREDVPADALDEKRRAFSDEAAAEGRPADRIGDIVEGKLNKWLESVGAAGAAVSRHRQEGRRPDHREVAKLGENIRVARFARMAVGETAGEQDGEEAA